MKRTSKHSAASTASIEKGARKQTPFRANLILVPLDFSDPSSAALQYAGSLAQRFGGKLILLYALEPVATPDFEYYPLMLPKDEAAAKAEQELDRVCKREKIDSSLIEKIIVRNGVAHSQITEAAKSLNADLIVIATHGRTGFKHVMLGSTAERVVRHAECPVLVVRT